MIYSYVFQPLSLFLMRWTWRLELTGWGAFAISVGFPTLLTFIIVGIWHGAGWTFVAFGAMHAIYVSVFEIWRERRTRLQRKLRKAKIKLSEPGVAQRAFGHVLTLVAVLFANVMFRAKSVAGGLSVWAGMTGLRGTSTDSSMVDFNLAVTLLICVAMVAFFPNTQQIMSRFDPAYNWYEWQDVAPPLISWTWRPNTVGLMLAGAVLFFGVVFIQRGQAIFLYFNF
jgi:D-alanyl-lipoteichoic acid acyltransferase DltB (MBOAT superfamily)